jgi:hypothetical protein
VKRVSSSVDRVGVTFDDATLVANAGLVVPATLRRPEALTGTGPRDAR